VPLFTETNCNGEVKDGIIKQGAMYTGPHGSSNVATVIRTRSIRSNATPAVKKPEEVQFEINLCPQLF
jgi:hypothetical protein